MKSNSFSKKLLSVFLAVLMAFSCLSGVMSANAASADTDKTLYDDKLAYNFLGWVDTTDDQVLDALLDFADEMLAEHMSTAKGSMDLSVATLSYDITSINGVLATLESLRNDVLSSGTVDLASGADLAALNVGGHRRNYYTTGGGSGFISNSNPVMTRENSTSKEIIRGIFNFLYMNSNGFAYKSHNGNTDGINEGGNIVQHFLNGSFSIGGLEGAIVNIVKGLVNGLNPTENSVYGIIGGLLGLPVGYQKNLVNNIVVFLMKNYVADKYASQGMINTVNTSGSTYYFTDASGNAMSLEQWAFDAVNKCVLNTLIGADGEYIFKDSGFKLDVNDNAYDDIYGAFVPLFKHTLLPLFSTISLDFNFVTEFTKMYYRYVNAINAVTDETGAVVGTNIDASTPEKLASYWTADKINAWINADYVEIGKYIGNIAAPESTPENKVYLYPGMAVFDDQGNPTGVADDVTAETVKAAMIELFESLDRHSDEIDASKLFTCLLYSPVAEALGIETGVLNLNLKDYYLSFNNISNFFDFSVFTQNGNIKSDAYALLTEMLSFMFPKFNNWAPASGDQQNISNIVSEVVASAGNLIKYVGDSVCPAIFAGYDVINESNIEQAILPFVKAILCEVDITKMIHEEEWEKCDDLEDMLYVALTEYLHYSLPQYDYSKLVTVENGHYTATIEKMLPMARDALAYVMQTSVPLTTNGSDDVAYRWDVFENGGTDENGNLKDSSFTAFDMLNSLVVYYATESNIAPLLNITNYTVYGTTGADGYKSAITTKNTIWQNIDIIAEKLFPLFGDWFGVDKINSEEFVMDTLVNGFLNIAEPNNSSFGHGKQGISAILYNLVYMFTDSTIMTRPFIPVVYEFVKNIFDVILGARDNKDEFGFAGALPANTGVQPITDLLSSRIIAGSGTVPSGSGCDYNSYSTDGIVGILIGRIAENSGAGELRTKTTRTVPDTVLPAATKIIKMANDMAGFMPILSDHQFKAPEVSSTSNVIEGYYSSDLAEAENPPYIEIKNAANGLNAAIFENGSDQPIQLDRYFIRVEGIRIVDEDAAVVDIDTRYKMVPGQTVTYAVDPDNETKFIAPNESAYYKLSGYIFTPGVATVELTYSIVDKNNQSTFSADYTHLKTTGQFLVTEEMSTETSKITFTPKTVPSAELAAKIQTEVTADRQGLDETNFDIFTYRLMVKAAHRAEALVYGTYDKDFVAVSSSDPTFESVLTYDFYAASDTNHETLLANTTLTLFQADVEAGKYEAQGVPAGSVEGTDYVFGNWVPSASSLDENGNIIYKYVTDADAATVNEAIRVYNLYKAQIVHRGYVDNDRALLQELLCATGDAYNYNYKIDDLKNYVGKAFTANVVADGVSTVAFTATNTNTAPKYGALENGQLVNNGKDKYTEESWNTYINALAAAVDFIKTASTDKGYRQGMYNGNADYTHQVTDISYYRTNLMKAENQLEVVGNAPVPTGHSVSAYIGALAKPADAYGTYAVTGATVTVGDVSAVTDETGKFTLEGIADGTYEATVTYQYGFTRTFTIEVNGADVASDVMVGIVGCDISGDSVVNNGDYSVYKGYVGVNDMSSRYVVGYDFNRDGVINNGDYALYKNFIGKNIQNIVYTNDTVVK